MHFNKPVNHCAYAGRQISLYWTMTALAGVYTCLVMTLMWCVLQLIDITYWMDQLYWPTIGIMAFSFTVFQLASVTHRRELFPIFYPHLTHAWRHAVQQGWIEEV